MPKRKILSANNANANINPLFNNEPANLNLPQLQNSALTGDIRTFNDLLSNKVALRLEQLQSLSANNETLLMLAAQSDNIEMLITVVEVLSDLPDEHKKRLLLAKDANKYNLLMHCKSEAILETALTFYLPPMDLVAELKYGDTIRENAKAGQWPIFNLLLNTALNLPNFTLNQYPINDIFIYIDDIATMKKLVILTLRNGGRWNALNKTAVYKLAMAEINLAEEPFCRLRGSPFQAATDFDYIRVPNPKKRQGNIERKDEIKAVRALFNPKCNALIYEISQPHRGLAALMDNLSRQNKLEYDSLELLCEYIDLVPQAFNDDSIKYLRWQYDLYVGNWSRPTPPEETDILGNNNSFLVKALVQDALLHNGAYGNFINQSEGAPLHVFIKLLIDGLDCDTKLNDFSIIKQFCLRAQKLTSLAPIIRLFRNFGNVDKAGTTALYTVAESLVKLYQMHSSHLTFAIYCQGLFFRGCHQRKFNAGELAGLQQLILQMQDLITIMVSMGFDVHVQDLQGRKPLTVLSPYCKEWVEKLELQPKRAEVINQELRNNGLPEDLVKMVNSYTPLATEMLYYGDVHEKNKIYNGYNQFFKEFKIQTVPEKDEKNYHKVSLDFL